MRIVDAWMQHPSAAFLRDPMFDPLRRWAHGQFAAGEVPVEATVAAMDAAGVQTGMLCAWWGPRGPLIANDDVAAMCRSFPGHGRRKVLFGSNHPAWPAADCLEGLRELDLDEETTRLFLHSNAERVFGLASLP